MVDRLYKNKRGFWFLLFTPIGIAVLIILALVLFGIIGFGVFLTFNLLTIGGLILIIAGLIAVIRGNTSPMVLTMVVLGAVMLILPKIFDFASKITLASVLGG